MAYNMSVSLKVAFAICANMKHVADVPACCRMDELLEQSNDWAEFLPALPRPTGVRLHLLRLMNCLIDHWPFKKEVNQNSIPWILCILLSV